MQRPRSEGRRPASGSRPSMVSRSLQFSTGDQRGRCQYDELGNPRRPNTTPKPRIQRLLPPPGQRDWQNSRQLMVPSPSVLIRLPNSPPRLNSIDPFAQASETNIAISDEEDATELEASSIPTDSSSPSLGLINGSANSDSNNEEGDTQTTSIPDNSTISLKPNENEGESSSAGDGGGPILADIRGDSDLQSHRDEDDEYSQSLANRIRLLHDEATRQHIRDELETYVNSLSSRTDEKGDHLVEFPRNYQHIVSLMTQKDVREEDDKSQDGQTSRRSWSRVLIESGLSKQQAFGILEDGDDDPDKSSLAAKIALKMAHIRQLDTILEEKLGKNLYASIIPKKQKRAKPPAVPIVTKGISIRTSSASSSNRTFVTQTQSILADIAANGNDTSRSTVSRRQSDSSDATLEWLKGNCAKKNNNFIERNKQVVANGMKANMTKDEEARLAQLLCDDSTPATDSNDSDLADGESNNPETSVGLQECNEFAMEDAEKEAIRELIASKSGAYPLFAIDELQDGPTNEFLRPADNSNLSAKSNVIQETKRERLQMQRLSRVEQELRFLQDSPSVIIVGDDDDENDDCRSELSFTTIASSTCSTRSGIISRHDFKCFLAQQKETFQSTPTASVEEIQRLLLTLGPRSATASSPMTATTG